MPFLPLKATLLIIDVQQGFHDSFWARTAITRKPKPDEPVLVKQVNSAMIGTDLEDRLRQAGVTDLVVTGLATNHCVSTTTRMAANLGFRVTLVSDATATFGRRGPDGMWYSAETLHAVGVAELHEEFATVQTTDEVLNELNRGSAVPEETGGAAALRRE